MKYLFLILFAVSCAETPPPRVSKVDKFVTTWKEDFGHMIPSYETALRHYLVEVENFFAKNNKLDKFDFYLNSLVQDRQRVAHVEMNLPTRYKHEKGHWPVQRSMTFINYKEEHLKDLRERLESERQVKLQTFFGQEFYQQFKDFASTIDRKGHRLRLQY